MSLTDIKNMNLHDIQSICAAQGLPVYVSKQIFEWIYVKSIRKFSLMSNISKNFRDYLENNFYISQLPVLESIKSADKTTKFLFSVSNKNTIETVLIEEKNRKTLCISTQVGCKYRCAFCVSGTAGFLGNLETSHIVNQFMEVGNLIKPDRLTNLVFMGIGEPLDNFDNLIKAIQIIKDKQGIGLGKRKITVSTCGISPMIRRLADLRTDINLTVSLHSANDKIRSQLMPVNIEHSLRSLIMALKYFVKAEGYPVTFEYILIKGVNCSAKDAIELANYANGVPHKINLIPYNVSSYFKWKPPSAYETSCFTDVLKKRNILYTIRKSKGQNINASCGQLMANLKNYT
ncbi:MAG: 23S rRNA (adenine(2503)-C(2))-methyltransferase RlmN [Elusimicrobiota bacterium]